jgi:hypothetical protein
MIVSDTPTAAFKVIDPGTYLSRCTTLVDLGTQKTEFSGETKSAHKVLLGFEILDTEQRRDDGAPFVLSKRFTLSLHEKSAMRKTLEGWRGRAFTPQELKGFDLKSILNKGCLISVSTVEKDGKTYANITNVVPVPKGMTAPEGTGNEQILLWDMTAPEPDWTAFAGLSPRLIEQIEASPEFKALKVPKTIAMQAPSKPLAPAAAPTPAPAPAPTAGAAGGFDMDDDIPW